MSVAQTLSEGRGDFAVDCLEADKSAVRWRRMQQSEKTARCEYDVVEM